MNEERSFGSKQAYLTVNLPDALQLRENGAGTWSIEDEGKQVEGKMIAQLSVSFCADGFKVCDGELMRHTSDQILLDYIPRDKQIARLKYELMVCEDDKCSMINGEVQPTNQTDSMIEFVIRVDGPETNST